MKLQLETIPLPINCSFQLLLHSRLNDFYFWHYHPELELNYIEGANGRRHIGEHISRFEGSSLIFIGSNIPHLNHDYGIKTGYKKTVLHLRPHFLKEAFLHVPEFEAIHRFFEKAKYGISIEGETKAKAGAMLQRLSELSSFEQFLELLRLFQVLAESTEITLLHEAPVKNQHNKKSRERLNRLYQFIDENYQRKITVEEVAELCHMTKIAFCRYFKQTTHLTFTAFLNHYRINEAKRLLLLDKNISEVCYECGFDSLSYFNRVFKKITRENPSTFQKQHSND
ncbi:helix-turn-helix transcriptional regulator [Runella slithyformis]|uniref:Transcriptional regulator, AraC family n=1 Tax=Runella slithyformis (strain ATCC 29530 / DSM 19594 / LMG 11500 / NCIMB 11436 / LSU 4) TaxID=761193 RepID=A0A7U3ZQZ7_RUNSL|nr:AraC family transcriptional regulator [Runella slithyformis]AEI51760.1 transcriptional regulator, AraC family [Runella slithyformis DSM 19594]